MSNTPSKAEIEALVKRHGATSYRNRADTQHPAYGFTEDGLNGLIGEVLAKWGTPQPVVREPLTDAQIAEMMRDTWGCASIAPRHALEFARAVESAITAARATGKAGAAWLCRMGADQDRQGP